MTKPSKNGRSFLTKEMLLPLAAARVRALSLENHLALATLRAGQGDFYQMSCLLRTIYLAYFIHAELAQPTEDVFPQAEHALARSVARSENGEGWSLADDEWQLITRILEMHDRQLSRTPRYVFERAWEQLQRFTSSNAESPISLGQKDH
ncbi:hypothetical protein G3N95_09860 [Paraburkholderia sp. Tr-20389]|uniref:hypothetical protein n=1 Tax=Paraburkholderia sp. Tr-20389 TaxID=2703903 RepID=UPI00197D0599|nr:hypothetical protein [Paraburkholderia sp. Tr-20389]MBN3753250.1 hypothetical protein [Paraburkholderia sp. Tr-20389]